MSPEAFRAMMLPVCAAIDGHAVDDALGKHLNGLFPGDGTDVRAIEAACHQAIAVGWMCAQGEEGRRFGRIVEPAPDTFDLSVDVVELTDVIGPHHRHPNGEICLVMPVTPTATFDGKGRGWCIYGPNSGHRPTVRDGQALVLYLLPGGAIEFTGR
ncbi:MAG: DUF4863 family protein [Xanthobacteraceae bacterium]|nr:MAG: DUF4863 family protein [Xanthobacteraceae bacterium]